jgi:hypothetical protein
VYICKLVVLFAICKGRELRRHSSHAKNFSLAHPFIFSLGYHPRGGSGGGGGKKKKKPYLKMAFLVAAIQLREETVTSKRALKQKLCQGKVLSIFDKD